MSFSKWKNKNAFKSAYKLSRGGVGRIYQVIKKKNFKKYL
jgi:hypothetical protein